MSQLEEIKGRAEEARPGPWEVIEDEGTVRTRDGEIMFDRSAESGSYWNAHGRRNADFIAHARTDVPKLLAALEAVEALAEQWRYKGEFGWGAWQEGHGPDPEGHVLDSAASDIRKAIKEALQ